jgi:glucose/arabinose dehydrogenase
MKLSSISWIGAVLLLGPSLCYPQQAQPAGRAQQAAPAPPRDTSPQVLDVQGGKIRVVTVATGLFHPWGIAFADANTILVTERNGALRIIHNGVLAPKPVWTSPAPATPPPASAEAGGQGGNDRLHFVAVHPDFAQNHLVYVSYPKTGEKGTTLACRARLPQGRRARRHQEIFRRRCLGDRRQPRRPRLLRQGQEPLRDDRRSRSHLLQRAATPSGRIG